MEPKWLHPGAVLEMVPLWTVEPFFSLIIMFDHIYKSPLINAQCRSMPIKIMALIRNASQCLSMPLNFDQFLSVPTNDDGNGSTKEKRWLHLFFKSERLLVGRYILLTRQKTNFERQYQLSFCNHVCSVTILQDC